MKRYFLLLFFFFNFNLTSAMLKRQPSFIPPITQKQKQVLNPFVKHTTMVRYYFNTNDDITEKEYTGDYAFAIPKPLIRIKSSVKNDKNRDVRVTIERIASAQEIEDETIKLILKAILSKKMMKKYDLSEKKDKFKKQNWVWKPWEDDTEKELEETFATTYNAHSRGCGTRLKIELMVAGAYELMIPISADLEVSLKEGTILYKSDAATTITAKAGAINHLSTSPRLQKLTDGRLKTELQWGDNADPKTKLSVKNDGKIFLQSTRS